MFSVFVLLVILVLTNFLVKKKSSYIQSVVYAIIVFKYVHMAFEDQISWHSIHMVIWIVTFLCLLIDLVELVVEITITNIKKDQAEIFFEKTEDGKVIIAENDEDDDEEEEEEENDEHRWLILPICLVLDLVLLGLILYIFFNQLLL